MEEKLHIFHDKIDESIQDLINALPFYVLLVDDRHHIVQANRAVTTQLGLVPEQIIGKYCPKVVHGIDTAFHGCPLEESVETGQPIEKEVFDDHSGRWLNSAIYPTNLYTRSGNRIFFHMVLDISQRKLVDEERELSSERLRNLSAHLEAVVEEERQKISRDLHDDISQVVASINAYLATALNKLPDDLEDIKKILNKAQNFSVQILDRIHRLILQLRPTILDDFGLATAIEWLVENSLYIVGTEVDYKVVGKEKELSPEIRITIFRVVQEAINNINKHAKANKVKIRIFFRKQHIEVKIKDNGVGFEVYEALNTQERPRGLGLVGMQERIRNLNGQLDIESGIEKGSNITLRVPYGQKISARKGTGKYLWSSQKEF